MGIIVTLFEHNSKNQLKRMSPLAARMRPRSFDEFIGQDDIIGAGRVLRKSIDSDQIPSIILWGPPGSGKTTLASLIASVTSSYFSSISAVGSGVSDLRNAIKEAQTRLGMHGQRTILFIDEIHRFNKAQQDVILPDVENGTVVLVGATTENPSFEVIAPLLSRARVFALNALSDTQIEALILRAATDQIRGIGHLNPVLDNASVQALTVVANGDARIALNTLELATMATDPDDAGFRNIKLEAVENAAQQRTQLYDKSGDHHYDTISAFIKSVRGSDPDSAIYWLARMIEAGESPMFIARRLVILASEDVGMADPNALTIAIAAQQAVHFIGMPEGRIPLAEATIYLASSPKSNTAYKAIDAALKDVNATRNDPVPMHLRNAPTQLMKAMGYGTGYKYAHDHEGNFAPMNNLPNSLKGRRYYQPGDQGYEPEIEARLRSWWGRKSS